MWAGPTHGSPPRSGEPAGWAAAAETLPRPAPPALCIEHQSRGEGVSVQVTVRAARACSLSDSACWERCCHTRTAVGRCAAQQAVVVCLAPGSWRLHRGAAAGARATLSAFFFRFQPPAAFPLCCTHSRGRCRRVEPCIPPPSHRSHAQGALSPPPLIGPRVRDSLHPQKSEILRHGTPGSAPATGARPRQVQHGRASAARRQPRRAAPNRRQSQRPIGALGRLRSTARGSAVAVLSLPLAAKA